MKYQQQTLPPEITKVSTTPKFDEITVPAAILRRHMAPANKLGRLVVDQGAVQFVWEDTGETFDVDPAHPFIIEPERYHHVHLNGPATFHIEFYRLPKELATIDGAAARPGEKFL